MTDDGAKKETVMVTPTAPLITVAGDAGMTHSYPQRTFKPEEPKTTETVTPKRSSWPRSPQFMENYYSDSCTFSSPFDPCARTSEAGYTIRALRLHPLRS